MTASFLLAIVYIHLRIFRYKTSFRYKNYFTKYLIDPPLWPNGIVTFFLQAEKFIKLINIYCRNP